MLTIPGRTTRFCDGVSRRGFLKIGGLALGGMSLSQILRAEEAQGRSQRHKSVIMILLPGGPPHQDMVDLKPHAPAEIRGEFQPIATKVPGIQISEVMPRLAARMDKWAIVRSLYGGLNDHNVHICLTGWETHPPQGDSTLKPGFPLGGWPSIGATVSKLHGPVTKAMPPFVSLSPPNAESTTRASLNQAGFLGIAHAGFEPNRKKRRDINYQSGVSQEQVQRDAEQEAEIVLKGITLDRLSDRRRLLSSFDRFRREADASGVMRGMDAINEQAMGILTSSKLADALDFRLEPRRVRKHYGISDSAVPKHGGPELLKQFLIARRLVEAGARCVTLAFSQWPLERMSRGGFNWDWHKENFKNVRATVPMLDIGLSALIDDLHQRGLDQDVSVVVWANSDERRKSTIKPGATIGLRHRCACWPEVACGWAR